MGRKNEEDIIMKQTIEGMKAFVKTLPKIKDEDRKRFWPPIILKEDYKNTKKRTKKETIKAIKLKKDFIIPAGTILMPIPEGAGTTYGAGNFAFDIETSNNSTARIILNIDSAELAPNDFEKITLYPKSAKSGRSILSKAKGE